MTFLQIIGSVLSASQSWVLLAAVVLVIVLLALLLGKEVRWSQHGYWKRRDVQTKRPKPATQVKGTGP